jgi:hypothetical protein
MIADNVLRNVCEYDRHDDGHGLPGQCRLCGAMKAAVAAFAAINGWKLSRTLSRNPGDLGRATREPHKGLYSGNDPDYRLFDHVLWFKAASRFVAAVGQPYDYGASKIDKERARLRKRGFVVHVPPDPLASLHNPGNATFMVVSKPGVTVRWLPEQDGHMAAAWQALNDAAEQRGEAKEARRQRIRRRA